MSFADQTDIERHRHRLKKVQQGILRWEAFERGEGAEPRGARKNALEDLRDTLVKLIDDLSLRERFPISSLALDHRRN